MLVQLTRFQQLLKLLRERMREQMLGKGRHKTHLSKSKVQTEDRTALEVCVQFCVEQLHWRTAAHEWQFK